MHNNLKSSQMRSYIPLPVVGYGRKINLQTVNRISFSLNTTFVEVDTKLSISLLSTIFMLQNIVKLSTKEEIENLTDS